MKKAGRILAAVAALAAVAWLASGAVDRADEVWLRVDNRDLVLGIPTEGELEAVDSALIGPPAIHRFWNFRISMMAPEGVEVVEGQPVLAFDTTELRQSLRQAGAEADSSQKQLEKNRIDLEVARKQLALSLEEARASLRRAELKTAGGEDLVARSELEKARIELRLAEAEIAGLESSLEQHRIKRRMELANLESRVDFARAKVADLEESIQRMTVKAPRAGTLILRSDWRRQKKQVGDRVWRAEKVLEIPDLSAMQAAAEVDEELSGRLAEGQTVTFRLDAYPDLEHRAKVVRIRNAVQRKSPQSPAKIVKFTLELEETDTERMRPGMRFRGTIVAEIVDGVLTVPTKAVLSDRDGAFVTLKGFLGRTKVYPELGRRNEDLVEVISGLTAGGRVLARPAESAGDA